MIRIAMAAVGATLAYTATIMLKVHGLGLYDRDFWVIVVSSGLATLLVFQSVSWRSRLSNDKPRPK